MDKEKAVQAFAPFFKEHGYQQKGNTFFKIENGLAFCILFERPTAIIYVHYYVLPLYIPTDNHYLTYGDRLESHSIYPVPSFNISEENDESSSIMRNIKDRLLHLMRKEPPKTDFSEWVKQVQKCLAEDIFPFFASINSPDKLLCFLRKGVREKQKYFRCLGDEYQNSRLAAYTCLYTSDLESASEYVARAQRYLLNSPNRFPEKALKMRLDELSVAEQMIQAPKEARDAFLNEAVAHTLERCFPIRSPKTQRTL